MNPELPRNRREKMEARLTALLLGELSADEAAAVRRAIEQDGELAKLFARLHHAIPLVREATASPDKTNSAPTPSLKLSDERRQKLLAQFKTVAPKEFVPVKRRARLTLVEMAAVLVILGVLGAITMPSLKNFSSTKGMVETASSAPEARMAADAAMERAKEELFLRTQSVPGSDSVEVSYFITNFGAAGQADTDATKQQPTTITASVYDGGSVTTYGLEPAFRSGYQKTPSLTPLPAQRGGGTVNFANNSAALVPPAPAGSSPAASKPQIILPQSTPSEVAQNFGDKFGIELAGQSAVASSEPLLSKDIQLRYANPANVQPVVQDSLSDNRSKVTVNAGNGQLAVRSTQAEIEAAENLARKLDVPTRQTLVESRIVETSRIPQSGLISPTTGLPVAGEPAASAKAPLETRTYSVDPKAFRQGLESVGALSLDVTSNTRAQTDPTIPRVITTGGAMGGGGGGGGAGNSGSIMTTNSAGGDSDAVRSLYATLGVNLNAEEGKSVFYNDRKGVLLVRATPEELETTAAVNESLAQPPPTVNVKAKFAETAQADNQALGFDWYAGKQPAKGTSEIAGVGGTAWVDQSAQVQTLGDRITASGRVAEVPVAGVPVLEDAPVLGRFSTNSARADSLSATALSDGGRIVAESNVYSFDVVGYANVPSFDRNASPQQKASLERLEQQISQQTRELENLRQQLHLSEFDAGVKAPQPLLEMEEYKRFIAAKFEREVALKGRKEQFDQLSALSKKELRDVLPDKVPDPTLTELLNELNAADQKFKSLGNDVSEKHPEYIRVTEQQKLLNEKIDTRVSGNLKRLETELAMAKSELDSLVESVETARKLEQEKLAQSRPYYDKKRELEELSRLQKEASIEANLPVRRPATNAPIPQPEVQTSENNFSTFSLNVSDVSFKLAVASLEKGQMPDVATVRSEEFINAFDYRDPESLPGAPIAFAYERARYPFAHNRDLLRFSLKTAAAGRQAGRPLNVVLLLDNSGSMERADRVRIIREALSVLADQLQPQDKLSVITFARTPRLFADGAPGSDAGAIAMALTELTPEGGTNLEEAMNLAYQTAARHYLANGINRVVLLTDGAANLGDVEPESLKQKVEAQRKQGIALDCFGIGWDGFNDDLLEVLSRNGDGRYGFINSPEEAATEFVGQLAGALQVAASDVKVQVEFNPRRVTAYRQIGYAKHQLTKEQFRDNTVDAAEIAAQEAGNALYTVEANPAGSGPIATVRVRYKVPGTTDYREQAWDVPFTGNALSLEQSSPAMRLAASASAFSEWLVASPFAGEVSPDALLGYLRGVPEVFGADSRPKRLEWMIRQAKSLERK